MLGAVSTKTTNQKIGSSIINIFSRSPSTIAMGAITVDSLSNGRLVLGLGTSSFANSRIISWIFICKAIAKNERICGNNSPCNIWKKSDL